MHACMHACMHAWMYVCMYVYIYMCIYIYICTYIHTYIHTYKHTCTHTMQVTVCISEPHARTGFVVMTCVCLCLCIFTCPQLDRQIGRCTSAPTQVLVCADVHVYVRRGLCMQACACFAPMYTCICAGTYRHAYTCLLPTCMPACLPTHRSTY